MGKTNVLDAIYYLCITKSYFGLSEQQLLQHGAVAYSVQGNFRHRDNLLKVKISFSENTKKELWINEVKYNKMADFIGTVPIVMTAPNDQVLIEGASEERRKFLDLTLSQTQPEYLKNLMLYNRLLQQRNSLLKFFADKNNFDYDYLQSIDLQLFPLNNYIFKVRKYFLEELKPLFDYHYLQLSGGKEQVNFTYESELNENNIQTLFARALEKDRLLKRTHSGIHREDVHFSLQQYALKKLGSQGQQKSFLLALKLAQADYLKGVLKKAPLLLLDDIFDKLDESRSVNLISYLLNEYEGQVFITNVFSGVTNSLLKDSSITWFSLE